MVAYNKITIKRVHVKGSGGSDEPVYIGAVFKAG